MTVYPARRVKDRILCGRPTPIGRCIGEIARVTREPFGGVGIEGYPLPEPAPGAITERIRLPLGMAEDPPGSHHWRMKRRPRHRRPSDAREAYRAPALPIWRECPVCKVLAFVDATLLGSQIPE